MKKVLITGAGSYIGTSFERYLAQWPEKYHVSTEDVTLDAWREKNFSGYDTVYHVAGIAHSDTGNITDEKKAFYYKINTELAVDVAEKAKRDGVKQFVFMSSIIVYGDSAPIGKRKVITGDTPVKPANFYGDSKYRAEIGLQELEDAGFKVVIVRSPMIYGPGCKGNYPLLSKLARKLPAFPKVENQRSMIYIGNLVEFIRLMVENEERGIFCPQNAEYTNTTQLVKCIAKAHDKKILTIPGFGWLLKLLGYATGLVDKAFGSMCYEKSLSQYQENYCLTSLEESVFLTERAK